MEGTRCDGFVSRWRWAILLAWLLAAGLMIALVPPGDPTASELDNFLPPQAPYSQALDAFHKAFSSSALSEIVVVFERSQGPLTSGDRLAIAALAERIKPSGDKSGLLKGVTVLSPDDIPLEPNPLISTVSSNGQAALIRMSVPSNYITKRSDAVVRHVRTILQEGQPPLPPGLRVAITGSSGYGHDYAQAAEESHTRTLYATLIAVTLILLLVYRAPLAAMVPLIAISLAAVVAIKILSLCTRIGLHVGTAESIFVVVLIYGAGVDYSLLLISRFREFIDDRSSPGAAADKSLGAALAAILAAAATNILGLLMLCFAQYRIFQTTGPAVAIALAVALLASLTLVPALLAVLGNALFWPRIAILQIRSRLWPRIGDIVTTRPLLVLLVTITAMAYPIYRGANQTWVYDTLASIQAKYTDGIGNAAAGVDIARGHWPVGEIAPVKLLIQSPTPLLPQQWQNVSKEVTSAMLALRDPEAPGERPVANVRSLSQPLGKDTPPLTSLLLQARQDFIRSTYIGADNRAMRLDVLMSTPALELLTMQRVKILETRASEVATDALRQFSSQPQAKATIFLAGATAEMIDTRAVTHSDFHLIAVLVLSVILVIMLVLLRQVLLSVFMVISTVVSYFATLGMCHWLLVSVPPLVGLAGLSGLDWKVEIFLFVVMVSVGQDYNIFLAGRLMQEARRLPARLAAREALVHTGPVISSAGLIMAATLGSLMAGNLALLVQLGFAMALGMLIDTFVVRPLLLPAFAVLTGKTGKPMCEDPLDTANIADTPKNT
jgi:RND superfamily putative drug exporter